MSRSLKSYDSIHERKQVIKRRLKANTGGLGFLSVLEAAKVYKIEEEAERKAAEVMVYVEVEEAIGQEGNPVN